jgi:hypothetical protein
VTNVIWSDVPSALAKMLSSKTELTDADGTSVTLDCAPRPAGTSASPVATSNAAMWRVIGFFDAVSLVRPGDFHRFNERAIHFDRDTGLQQVDRHDQPASIRFVAQKHALKTGERSFDDADLIAFAEVGVRETPAHPIQPVAGSR